MTIGDPATMTAVIAPLGQEDIREAPGEAGTITAPRPPRIAFAIIIISSGTRRSIVNALVPGTRAILQDSAVLPNLRGNGSNSLNEDASRTDAHPAPREAEDAAPATTSRR